MSYFYTTYFIGRWGCCARFVYTTGLYISLEKLLLLMTKDIRESFYTGDVVIIGMSHLLNFAGAHNHIVN